MCCPFISRKQDAPSQTTAPDDDAAAVAEASARETLAKESRVDRDEGGREGETKFTRQEAWLQA